jgi:hypothetical protein
MDELPEDALKILAKPCRQPDGKPVAVALKLDSILFPKSAGIISA